MQYRTEIFVDDAILTVKVGDRVGLRVGLIVGERDGLFHKEA